MKDNRLLSRVSNLRRLGTVASVQLPGGHTQLCRRGVIRWLKAGRLILGLAGALVACVCLSPTLHAGIIFEPQPQNATVYPGGTINVPIMVNSSGLSGANWMNAQFTITWDPSVLVLQLTTPYTMGSALAGALTPPSFNTSTSGQLYFKWADTSTEFLGITVANGDTLFTVNFQAVGGWENYGNHTDLTGIGIDQIGFRDITSTQPTFRNGTVTIVPEPINWALGLFACVFIGTATVRWISRRHTSLQSLAGFGALRVRKPPLFPSLPP